MSHQEDQIFTGADPVGDARLESEFAKVTRLDMLRRMQLEACGTGRHPVESIDGKDVTGVESMDRVERSWLSTADQMRGRHN